MSLLTILRARLDNLTDGERLIAGFVLKAPDRMITLSSAELAGEVGCSQSSVVKFCQKQGFRGYQDFRLAVGQAAARAQSVPTRAVHGTIDNTDTFATTIEKLLGSKLASMQQTASINGEATVTAALEAIEGARRIQLAGVGASSLVARDLTYKLQKLGHVVYYDADSHIQVANATTLNDKDLVIAFSLSGDSLETRQIAETATAKGAKLISITGPQPNRLSEMADICLHVVADEQRARSSAIFSRDAQLTLGDLLFIMLVQREQDSGAHIQAAETAVTALKS